MDNCGAPLPPSHLPIHPCVGEGAVPAVFDSSFLVREVTSPAERAACYRLRYDAHIAEHGRPCLGADHARRELTDALDDESIVLGAWATDGRPIATLRISFGSDPRVVDCYRDRFSLARFLLLGPERFSFASCLAIHHAWRHTNLFRDLIIAGYLAGSPEHVVLNFCSCRPALTAVFQYFGYEHYGHRFSDEGGAAQHAMVLVTRDRDHLARIKSPLLAPALTRPLDATTRNWLDRARVLPE